jgi:hypothetical protein
MPEDSEILSHIRDINYQLQRQNSLLRMLMAGMLYGVGFVIGSAFLATIVFGVFGPIVSQIPWVQNTFQIGESFRR